MESPASLVRPVAHWACPIVLPTTYFDMIDYITFYHPSYSNGLSGDNNLDVDALLFRLPAFDNGGLHYGTALAACRLVANNQPGYFTAGGPTGGRITADWDDVLRVGIRYYYHVEPAHEVGPYPVIAFFADWVFQAAAIPPQWIEAFSIPLPAAPRRIIPASQMEAAVYDRDGSCRITDCRDATKAAHIVPKTELAWFHANGMYMYNTNNALTKEYKDVIDDERNRMLLRKDLHYSFDRSLFCPVVKEGWVVLHFLEQSNELGTIYHNAEMRLPVGDPCVEFFWARFAWSVLPFAASFVERQRLRAAGVKTGQERTEIVRTKSKGKKRTGELWI